MIPTTLAHSPAIGPVTTARRLPRIVLRVGRPESMERARRLQWDAVDEAASRRVVILSSYQAFQTDGAARRREQELLQLLEARGAACTILRLGNIAPSRQSASRWQRFLARFDRFLPNNLQSVYVDRTDVRRAIRHVVADVSARSPRYVALLGPRRPLPDVLAEWRSRVEERPFRKADEDRFPVAIGLVERALRAALFVLISTALKIRGPLKNWTATTIRPASRAELISLCGSMNRPHIVIAGRNTGVEHFGWKFPRQTIVLTGESSRTLRTNSTAVTVDAGVLLKDVVAQLRLQQRDLFVIPNYSYISMGTIFMVPIHGSGTEVSTLGETIESITAYDPRIDRVVRLRRGDGRFEQAMYSPRTGLVVLRVRMRVRSSRTFYTSVRRLIRPDSETIWKACTQTSATNVELRKLRATDEHVEVREFFPTPLQDGRSLAVPRDSIGRIWDRIESNRATACLFHAYVRWFGYHVELFLDRDEFRVFWEHHATLPLAKIQLRFVHPDGLPHSPIGDRPKISIDLFMARAKRHPFLEFMKKRLPNARFNPGKHSM